MFRNLKTGARLALSFQQNASFSEKLVATTEEMSGQAQQLQAAMAHVHTNGKANGRDHGVPAAQFVRF